ncbi:uncharacterized protein LOC124848782 [Vigna umbellata]|uniref:uncharacterized protein LOC124848782 n=1 Tax=Vigna umbellata TaxID=87088 RepID=UPI001F5FACAA|nr:uncharacterized protein LOC124848782 [Vigna umbellata]
MRVEELHNSLEVHEQRLIERRNAEKGVSQGTNQALQARSDQNSKVRGAGRGQMSRSGLHVDETSHVEEETCWYLDTRCSNHMTTKREWLIDLDTSIRSSVRFADNSVIMAEEVDKILITRKDG